MTTVAMNSEQQARLQSDVQAELERREWAEPGDNVMAEYVTVLIANGNNRERVLTEMDDLVGADFDPQFLDWLFDTASDIQRSAEPAVPPPARSAPSPIATQQGGSRLLSSALASSRDDSNKRKADVEQVGANKKRISDQGLPSGPRAMEGRSLQDRMGPRRQLPMQVRGAARPAGNMGQNVPMGMTQPGFQQNFRPPMLPNMPNNFGFFPQQQEMMAQMMMMQASMVQMGEMMQKMADEKDKPPAPTPIAGYGTEKAKVKVPQGTKLGSHSVSAINPKPSPGPIPAKPTSKALCRYSIGCSNSRCPYSHPSPVADEQTGMVLSDEGCEEGKNCKDAECTKSHVSPAAALGDAAGPSRLLCKYQNCTNPACPFRHEDAEGKAIPPPALSAKPKAPIPDPSSDNEDGDVEVVMSSKNLMDGALDDSKAVPACRYGERCTRVDCKFTHPASRPPPKARATPGMNKSKKFSKMDPTAGEFVPKVVT